MTTSEDQRRELAEKVRANAASVIRAVVEDTQENYDLRRASEANNRTHGYTHKFGEDGYVEYQDRDEDWNAVDKLINEQWDRRTDEVETHLWELAVLLTSLSNDTRYKIIDAIRAEVDKQV